MLYQRRDCNECKNREDFKDRTTRGNHGRQRLTTRGGELDSLIYNGGNYDFGRIRIGIL